MSIFDKIINKEIPAYIIYEDESVIAFLDIAQTTLGHTLVVPKKHAHNFLDVEAQELASLIVKAQEIARQLMDKLNAQGMNILMNCNEVAGQTVDHYHIHLIPRYSDKDTITIQFTENKVDLAKVLQCIKA